MIYGASALLSSLCLVMIAASFGGLVPDWMVIVSFGFAYFFGIFAACWYIDEQFGQGR